MKIRHNRYDTADKLRRKYVVLVTVKVNYRLVKDKIEIQIKLNKTDDYLKLPMFRRLDVYNQHIHVNIDLLYDGYKYWPLIVAPIIVHRSLGRLVSNMRNVYNISGLKMKKYIKDHIEEKRGIYIEYPDHV